ncbi:MAG: carbamate kinase [Bacilli bacterium]|nr:carbamate kinase [Bacilli bacterium]
MSRLVIALGGNALGDNYLTQQELLKQTAKDIVSLIEKGHEVVITHGNGPQVGMINLAFDNNNIKLPLDICTAMSQGYIGFHIQNEILYEINKKNINYDVATLLTEVIVDKNDEAFLNPTKPIGKFYTEDEVKQLNKNNEIFKEDAGRGYRRVVASPKPIKIKNKNIIKKLLENKTIVVACGGGGIPVFDNEINVNAVIDKDLTSSLLAKEIEADFLIILTAVEQVELNFGKENAKKLEKIDISELKECVKNNEFAKGSMLPKIEAAINFTSLTGNQTIITSLKNLGNVLENVNKTIIEK